MDCKRGVLMRWCQTIVYLALFATPAPTKAAAQQASVPVSIFLYPPAAAEAACIITAGQGLSFGAVRRTRHPPPLGYVSTNTATMDETTTPGTYSLSGDAIEGGTGGSPHRGEVSIKTDDRQALILVTWPTALDGGTPSPDPPGNELTEIPYAPTWAYHDDVSMTGSTFTSLTPCTPGNVCSQSHRIPPFATYEYAFGGTITIAHRPRITGLYAALGSYAATIDVSIACQQ